MAAEGVVFKTKCEVGKNISANQLVEDYDAILLAVGSICPRNIHLPGDLSFILFVHSFIYLFIYSFIYLPLIILGFLLSYSFLFLLLVSYKVIMVELIHFVT